MMIESRSLANDLMPSCAQASCSRLLAEDGKSRMNELNSWKKVLPNWHLRNPKAAIWMSHYRYSGVSKGKSSVMVLSSFSRVTKLLWLKSIRTFLDRRKNRGEASNVLRPVALSEAIKVITDKNKKRLRHSNYPPNKGILIQKASLKRF